MPRVRFSFNVFGAATTDLVPLAQHGERCGFEAVWLGDHVLAPKVLTSRYPYATVPDANPLDGTVLNDVWVAVGALLASTSAIKVATGVYVLPQRSPFVTALAAATAQAVSGGRFMLGVGAGWLREEFELLGHDFERRGRAMDETIEIMRLLWSGGFESYAGDVYRFDDVRAAPPAPPPPILVGGATPAALRRAARLGDGWYGIANLDLEAAIDARDRIERERIRAGREGGSFRYFVRLAPDASLDNARRFAEAGFIDLTIGTNKLWKGVRTLQGRLDVLSRLSEQLVDPFR